MTRYTVHFAGDVQGVGFRYTTTHIARSHCVAGYVQNLPDGRVRLVAEGEKADLDALVAAVQQRMADHIHRTTLDESQPTGEFGVPARGALSVRR